MLTNISNSMPSRSRCKGMHDNIRKYYQSTSEAHAKVLHNLKVGWSTWSCWPWRSNTAMMVLIEISGGRRLEPWRRSRSRAACTPFQSPCMRKAMCVSPMLDRCFPLMKHARGVYWHMCNAGSLERLLKIEDTLKAGQGRVTLSQSSAALEL